MKSVISIIVPIYNVELYLKQCLDSIVCQSYSKIEIICVDDKSTDNSWEILKSYASKDTRFHIFRKKNEGVSVARNFGMKKATGDYLMFVDSDDWIDQETCERAINAIKEYNADVVMWSYMRELSGESRPKIIFDKNQFFEGQEVKDKLHRRMYGVLGDELKNPESADALCTVWGKLYRRDIIEKNQIQFFDIRKIGTYEDGLFNVEVFRHVNKAVFMNQCLYHYRRDNGMSITSKYNQNMKDKRNVLFDWLEQSIKKEGLSSEYVQALNNRIVLSLIDLGINEMNSPNSWNERIIGIRNIILSERYQAAISTFDYEDLPMHWKIFFKLAKKKCALGVFGLLYIIQMIRGR